MADKIARIQFYASSPFDIGDVIEMHHYEPDARRWRRFWHWLLHRPKPMRLTNRVFEVSGVISSSEFELEEVDY